MGIFNKASDAVEQVRAGSPALNEPLRSKLEAERDMLYESLEAIVAMSLEKTVQQYALRQLERADDLRG